MLRLIKHADLHDAVGHAADARRDRGNAGPVVAGVADDGHIGAEQIRVALDELGEVGGGALLFALDQELDGERHVTGERPERGGVDRDTRLVVGGPASIEAAVADLRFERGRVPLLQRAFRLHVVVGVQQDCRRSHRTVEPAEDRRMPIFQLQETGVRHPRCDEDVARRLGARPDVRRIVAWISLRWDPHQLFQVGKGLRHAGRDAGTDVVGAHGRERYRSARARVAPPASRTAAPHRRCSGTGRGAGTRAPARTRWCQERYGSRPRTAAAGRRRPGTARRTS